MTTRKRTLLVGASLLAIVIAFAAGGAVSSATTQPVEMKFACALKSNGLMRYVSSLSQCTKNETGVTVKPGPTLICVQPDGSVRKVPNFNQTICKKPAIDITLPPTSGNVYFCANNSTGVLRYVTDPSQCTATESPVFVSPNDAAPSV